MIGLEGKLPNWEVYYSNKRVRGTVAARFKPATVPRFLDSDQLISSDARE